MVETPEAFQGPKITALGDPRITRLGRFLRDTKLNELPQLVNVLRCEMSLVGPRPEDPEFVAHYTDEEREVLSLRPGITSLASVLYAREETMLRGANATESYLGSILPEKLRLDLLYVRNRSLLLDLDIILRTLTVLLPRIGRRTLRKEDMLRGPVRVFRRHFAWFTLDTCIAFVSVVASGVAWRAGAPLDIGFINCVAAAIVMTTVFSIANWISGVQHAHWQYASAGEAVKVTLSVALACALLLFINDVAIERQFPLGMVLLASFLALTGFMLVRFSRRVRKSLRAWFFRVNEVAAEVEKVLVVGAGELGQFTIRFLRSGSNGQVFRVIGVVDDDWRKLGKSIHGVATVALCDRISELVLERGIGVIVFAIHNIGTERRSQILSECRGTTARTIVAPNLDGLLGTRICNDQ